MANVLYFPNLKTTTQKANSTGTAVTDAGAAEHICLDVFARNDASNPLYTAGAPVALSVLATKFHDCAVTAIQNSAGAFVQVGTRGGDTAGMPDEIFEVSVNAAFGQPLDFRLGADATAAAAAEPLFILNKGAALTLSVRISVGEKIWVRSLDTASSSGFLILNLVGTP